MFGYADYAAAKAGVIALSRVLRSELRPQGIGVSVLLPTDTNTPGFAEENKRKPEETKAISGKAEVVSPELIAEGLFRGLEKGRFLIIPTFRDRLFCLVDRLMPRLVDRVMDMDVDSVRRRRKERGEL